MRNGPQEAPPAAAGASGLVLLPLSLLWGFAEATLFFILPDVLLSLIAVRETKLAIRASLFAAAGAVAGGALMWSFGAADPAAARRLLDLVPAISETMIAGVERQSWEEGLQAVVLGPVRQTPYKIYAAAWGWTGGAILPFLLVSFPARLSRFLLFVGAVRLLPKRSFLLVGLFWICLYSYYFARFDS
jgi:membrane protein YqaA with SNARE-associated domain